MAIKYISRKDWKLYELLDTHTNKRKRGFDVERLSTQDFFKHHYGMSNYYWTGLWCYQREDMEYLKKEYPDVVPVAQELEGAFEELERATGRVNRARTAYRDALWSKLYEKNYYQGNHPSYISEAEEEAWTKKQMEESATNLALQAQAKKDKA